MTTLRIFAPLVLLGLLCHAVAAGILWRWPQFSVVLVLAVAAACYGVMALLFAWRRSHRGVDQLVTALREQDSVMAVFNDRLARLETGVAQANRTRQRQDSTRFDEVGAELAVLKHLLMDLSKRQTAPATAASAAVTPFAEGASSDIRPGKRHSGPPTGAAVTDIPALLQAALDSSRVDLHLQPIVRLPSRKTVHYETFSRLRDESGRMLYPQQFLPTAEQTGLVGALDKLLLFRCVGLVRRLGPRRPGVRLFCNMSPAALNDSLYLDDFVDFLSGHSAELAERLVLEIGQKDMAVLDDPARHALMRLARMGFVFSVDQAADLHFNIPLLTALNVHYVKTPAAAVFAAPTPLDRADIRDMLQRHGMEWIVTHVEDEKTVVDLLDLNVDYGQGYLFGEPRPARQDVQATAQAA